MEFVAVRSSSLKAVAYNDATASLVVEFVNGNVYEYQNVPSHIFRGILTADSAGKYFNEMVKEAGYPYRQVR